MKRKLEKVVGKGQPEKEKSTRYNTLGDGKQWLRGSMIGKGSSGSVYLATRKKLKSLDTFYSLPPVMAVKSAEFSVSGSLQKENEVLNNLRGCSYVLHYFGEEITTNDNGDMVYNLRLQYASGGDLASLIKKSDGCGLPESDIRCYTRSIVYGLKCVHCKGYVHCDLKPANILLVPTSSSDYVATIGDFGSAKSVTQSKKRKLNPYLRGTPQYLSPEAVANNVLDPPSDIWALGCVVLEMFTGKPVWDRKGKSSSNDDLLRQIAVEGALPNIPDGIPEEGKSFLRGCFVREAKSRLTAGALLNHPFVRRLDEDIDEAEVLDVVSARKEVCSSASFSEEEDLEFSDSYCSDDSSYFSEEDSSWLEENRVRNTPLFCSPNHKAAIEVHKFSGMKISNILAGA